MLTKMSNANVLKVWYGRSIFDQLGQGYGYPQEMVTLGFPKGNIKVQFDISSAKILN